MTNRVLALRVYITKGYANWPGLFPGEAPSEHPTNIPGLAGLAPPRDARKAAPDDLPPPPKGAPPATAQETKRAVATARYARRGTPPPSPSRPPRLHHLNIPRSPVTRSSAVRAPANNLTIVDVMPPAGWGSGCVHRPLGLISNSRAPLETPTAHSGTTHRAQTTELTINRPGRAVCGLVPRRAESARARRWSVRSRVRTLLLFFSAPGEQTPPWAGEPDKSCGL